MLNYYEIGQRIRRYRKLHGLSQEALAERADVSVTHMSHIETGSTKLSLPTLVAIAEALSVDTDMLLYDAPQHDEAAADIRKLLSDCTPVQAKVIAELVQNVKKAIDEFQD